MAHLPGAGCADESDHRAAAAGTNLQGNCPSGSDLTACTAAFMSMHLTSGSNAYLEVRVSRPHVGGVCGSERLHPGHLALACRS